MSDAAAILRDVYGHNAAKKIARRFNVAVITAKVWLAGRFPESRTQELTKIVADELARLEERNREIRKRLGIEHDAAASFTETSGEAGRGATRGAATSLGGSSERMGREIGPERETPRRTAIRPGRER